MGLWGARPAGKARQEGECPRENHAAARASTFAQNSRSGLLLHTWNALRYSKSPLSADLLHANAASCLALMEIRCGCWLRSTCCEICSHHGAGDTSRRRFEAVAIAAAAYGSFVVSSSGKAAAFGVNASGQLGLDVAVRLLPDLTSRTDSRRLGKAIAQDAW